MKLRRFTGGNYGGWSFWCPGCDDVHALPTDGEIDGKWKFLGTSEAPAFSPSVVVRTGHYASHYDPTKHQCWCTCNKAQIEQGLEPSGYECVICHSFVGINGAQPGEIIFLGDSTHKLKDQVVPLPDYPKRHQG